MVILCGHGVVVMYRANVTFMALRICLLFVLLLLSAPLCGYFLYEGVSRVLRRGTVILSLASPATKQVLSDRC